ncbi:MAG: AAA family ATPase [Leptospiraceae bacterium]|nr:AAA family ATPase [Leptospiraceae bacterium]MCP5492937.1 AAA family ATPase [Leptospiraceae bacterium]
MKRLNIGNSDYKDIIENNNYYIDKSLLIQELIDLQKQVLLIPRPRRFGKTLNLLMLKYFFEKDKPENEKLFTGLKIWNCEKEILDKRGKYPVIYMSFKDAKANTWKKLLNHLKMEIARLYREHHYLLKHDDLIDIEKQEYLNITNLSANEAMFENSLKQLSEYLYRYHKEKVVILIDEYDTPIQSGYINKFYDDVIPFMRNLLSGAYKDNLYLYKGVITGILRVSKESIFTGLNNIGVYTILDNKFADKFGFTETEVKQILIDFNIPTSYEDVKKWYDGYTFGNLTDIYNPWSILNYMVDYETGFKPYWVNTSSDELLKERIKQKDSSDSRELILKLLNDEPVEKVIEDNFIFPDLDTNKDLLWTLLTFSGYLTIINKRDVNIYELRIPNYELKFVFKNTIIHWFNTEVKIIRNLLEDTARYLVNNQLDKFAIGFKKIIGDTFSYYDTASEPMVRQTQRATHQPEKVYQAYVLGLLAILSDDYIIRSNRESGDGRYDIMLIPHDKSKNGVVIEIKRIKKKRGQKVAQERIQDKLKSALNQIEENEYFKELVEHKVSNIIKVPIVFVGKRAYL